MKNKHLVFLFFATLIVGLLIRQAPWRRALFFQTDLIEVDTAAATQISIFRPASPELMIERTEAGWVAAQEIRSAGVRRENMAPMLEALFAVRSLRIVKTDRPDSLGFGRESVIQVVVFQGNKVVEQFDIGSEVLENGRAATFIRLNRHEGIYLVQNHLRGIFSKNLNDFREKDMAVFDPASVKKIILNWWENGLDVQYPICKNDSTGQWEPLGGAPAYIADDTVQNWLSLFSRLNGSPFADNFDESRARETIATEIKLHFANDSLILRVFYVKPPDVPEEMSPRHFDGLPMYVLHSSQNRSNFFAPADTFLLHRICSGLKPPPDPNITPKWKNEH